MQPVRPQLESCDVTLVELILVDDDHSDTLDIQVTDLVRLRLPVGIDPVLAAAVVEAICRC